MGESKDTPLVGFFPLFYNLAETGRAVSIAKRYIELGGNAVFFSHGGKYEYLAKDIGCRVIRVKPFYSKEFIDLLWKSSRLETFKNPLSEKILIKHVKEEVSAFKITKVKIIVSTNSWPCYLSTKVANLPLISVTPKIQSGFIKYPEDADYFFTRIIPQSLKLKILNWYAPKSKMYVRSFIKVAKKYNVTHPTILNDIVKGDYTFYTDFIDFLGLDKPNIEPNEYYVGIIFLDELFSNYKQEKINDQKEIEKHLQKPGKSILLTLGSSGTKELFIKILNTLDKTDYNVVAVHASIFKDEELPNFNDNIILRKFVPCIRDLHKISDISITHGGQGTVYTAAYAGKPVIGFPMQFEQHLNLENLVRHGTAIIESRKYFKEEKLLKAINNIFDNYDFYLRNAQKLASILPEPNGDKNAAKKLLHIVKKV